MRSVVLLLTSTLLLPAGTDDPRRLLIEHPLENFGEVEYARATEAIFNTFETRTGKRLVPAERGRVALKLSTRSGPGLSTPKALVRAVAESLRRRGFAAGAIVICDAEAAHLRRAGFAPANPLEPLRFEDLPARAWDLEAREWAELPAWRYENPMVPPPGAPVPTWHDARVSLLPRPLAEEFDFWLHLPVLSDSADLGVRGAIAGASLENATNTERFAGNPRNAAMAAVEMAAWPAIDSKRALTLLSLERYQIKGGPVFDAGWCRSEKLLLASANPVILDVAGLTRLRAGRPEDNAGEPTVLQAAAAGGNTLGSARPSEVTLVRLGER